nr:hypothetical protein [Streptomyces corallincola]
MPSSIREEVGHLLGAAWIRGSVTRPGPPVAGCSVREDRRS